MNTQTLRHAIQQANSARRMLDDQDYPHFQNLANRYDPDADCGPDNSLTQFDGERLRVAMITLCAAVQLLMEAITFEP